MTGLIALDWGTSNLRAFHLAGDGGVLARRAAPFGILKVEGGAFAAALQDQVGDWLAADPAVPVLLSGMIGSRQGWVEAPYVQAPAGLDDLAASLAWVTLAGGRRAGIVPGVSWRPEGGPPDVMRGEEIQVLASGADGLYCVPGTHSKWIAVEGGRIRRFSTHMTGELFELLHRHSILGRLMEEAPLDLGAFDEGLDRARDEGGLLHHLFGVRSRGLFGELPAGSLKSYLSGIVIGHEVRAVLEAERPAGPVTLIAASGLGDLYARALGRAGIAATLAAEDLAAEGLHRLAGRLASA